MIRDYEQRDLDAVIEAWYEASLVAHTFLPEEFFAEERELIATQWLPSAETIVCEVDGVVVGFLSLIGDEVGAVFVLPEHHGRGHGRLLMDAAVARRGSIELDVFASNEIGRRFYERYGFQEVDAHDDGRTGERVLRMRLRVAA